MIPFWKTLLGTTPPALSEFVFELGRAPPEFSSPSPKFRGSWAEVDQLFEGLLDRCPDFKLIIRTGWLDNLDEFQVQTKARFPSMARVDRVQFEMSSIVDKYWGECYPKSPGDRFIIHPTSIKDAKDLMYF